MKLAFFDAKTYDMPGFDACAKNTELEIKYFETRLNEDTVSLASGYDAVCVFVNDTVNAAVVEKLYRYGIRLIVLRCAGFNNVDIAACQGKIRVFRVPAYSPHAVAEHAMALLLTINRRTHKAYIRTRDFNFSLQGFVGFDLYGKTVGIVGTGKIGRVFADICKGFGMNVLAYDKYPSEASGLTYTTLEDLFQRSDIISLHCPLTEETKHMVNADSIAKMKKGVMIINTGRGGLIDTEALIDGLRSAHIGAAGLDVYEEEKDYFYQDHSSEVITDDKLALLLSYTNVLVTSHQAFFTREAMENIATTTLQNCRDFFDGKELVNEVR